MVLPPHQLGQRRPHLLRRRFELRRDQDEEELPLQWEFQTNQIEWIVATDEDEASHERRGDVVGVVAADLRLRFQASEDKAGWRKEAAEEGIDRDGGSGSAGGAGSEATTEGEAFVEAEGEADGADAEHAHGGRGCDAGAVGGGVSAESGGASDGGDGDSARRDGGVDGDSDGVAESVDCAAEEVEAGAEVGDGGGGKGFDGVENWGRVGGGGGRGGGRGYGFGGLGEGEDGGEAAGGWILTAGVVCWDLYGGDGGLSGNSSGSRHRFRDLNLKLCTARDVKDGE